MSSKNKKINEDLGESKPNVDFKRLSSVLGRVLGVMIRNYKFSLLVVVICILISALSILAMSLFMQSLIDDYIVPLTQQQNPDFSPLAQTLCNLAMFLIAGIVCAYGYNRIMVNVSQGTLLKLRLELFNKMETLPISYFDTNAHGDIMSVYTNDVDTLRQLISMSLPQLLNSMVSVLVTFVSMVVLDIPLTIISLAMVVIMVIVSTKLASKSSKYFVDQQMDLGRVNGYVEEMVEGQKVIKVFNHEEKALEGFRKINDELRNSAYKANMYGSLTMPVNANLGNISYVLCAVVGAVIAISGSWGLTLGTLVAFLSLNRSFTQPITQISQQVNMVVMAMAGAARIFDLMDQKPEEDDGHITLVYAKENEDGTLGESPVRTDNWAWKDASDPSDPKLVPMQGSIRFENVHFGYAENKQVLFDISLFAKPGQKIAFVGETGAGKTTISNLINRFYDIWDGSITYDGIDLREICKPDLRHSLGMVLQDTRLFTATVMDNIRFGRLDATDEECIAAAELANADSFIKRLPEGYQTVIAGNGAGLSQGQKQLLSIARAAVADPPVLILDEATSSIDTRTEILVQKGMDALMEGRTSFVIAHRLSTVRDSNCIMVMDHGRIIERGTHDELIEQQGKYYQLYTGNKIAS